MVLGVRCVSVLCCVELLVVSSANSVWVLIFMVTLVSRLN